VRAPPAKLHHGPSFPTTSYLPTAPSTRGQRALLRFFNSTGVLKRAVPRPSGAGMAGISRLFPGGGRRRNKTRLSFPKRN
jgi:hypothetical protein